MIPLAKMEPPTCAPHTGRAWSQSSNPSLMTYHVVISLEQEFRDKAHGRTARRPMAVPEAIQWDAYHLPFFAVSAFLGRFWAQLGMRAPRLTRGPFGKRSRDMEFRWEVTSDNAGRYIRGDVPPVTLVDSLAISGSQEIPCTIVRAACLKSSSTRTCGSMQFYLVLKPP